MACSIECKKKRATEQRINHYKQNREKILKRHRDRYNSKYRKRKEEFLGPEEPLNPPDLNPCPRCGKLTVNVFFCHECHLILDKGIDDNFIYGGYGQIGL